LAFVLARLMERPRSKAQSELVVAFDEASKIRKAKHYVDHEQESDYGDEHDVDYLTEFTESVVLDRARGPEGRLIGIRVLSVALR
jgi:hypothetical protein